MSSNPSGFHLEPRRVRRSNPSGFDLEPRGFDLRTLWVPRTLLGSISNPLGSTNPEGFEDRTLLGFEPSGFVEPRGFEDRTLWVRRSNPLGSISNPEGFEDTNPSGFVEPRGFEERTLWVRGTQRVRRHEPFWVRRHEPRRVRSSNPSGFEIEPRGVRSSNPEGFDLRTLWVRSRTQRVRRSSKMNFEDEVHLRRTKMKFIFELQKNFFFFFFFLVEIQIGSPPSINNDGRWRSNLDLHH
ncbi:hypothetical protein ACOSQ3_033409 [Xanthoceras sorbifolium]